MMVSVLRTLRVLPVMLLLAWSAEAGQVTLEWVPNSELDVTGYVVFYGTAPGNYSNAFDVGQVTGGTIQGLTISLQSWAMTGRESEVCCLQKSERLPRGRRRLE